MPFSLSLYPKYTGYKKYIDMILDSTLQLPFKKLSLVKYWRIPTIIWKDYQNNFSFSNYYYICEAEFSSHSSIKTTQGSRLNKKQIWEPKWTVTDFYCSLISNFSSILIINSRINTTFSDLFSTFVDSEIWETTFVSCL